MRLRAQRFERDFEAPAPTIKDWREGDVILGLYKVKGLLGEGGMGKVYRVRHTGWNIDLAVKSPRAEILRQANNRENFIREAETWVKLGLHPNVVSCYYIRTVDGLPRIFAECVEGGSLRDWIRQSKLLRLPVLLDAAIQFAWGLHFAHESGIIHQDVKPANVIMTPAGVAKVTDFGLAKARASAGEQVISPVAISTGMSILVSAGGRTPAYCSPEQAAGQAARPALDVYLEHGAEKPEIPRMPAGLVEILRQCFQADPDKRPHTLAEVAAALIEVYEQIAPEPYPRSMPDALEAQANALSNRALSLLDLGKADDAEQCFEQALQSDSHHPEATYNRGLRLWRAGRITDEVLVKQLDEVLSIHKREWRAAYLLGQVHLERSEAAAAVKALRVAVGLAGQEAEPRRALKRAEAGGSWGRCVWTVPAHQQAITHVAFHPDDLRVMSAGVDGVMKMWGLLEGQDLGSLKAHNDSVRGVAFTADGRQALSGSWDKTAKLWDLETGACLRTFKNEPHRVSAVAVTPDGRYGVTTSWAEGGVRIQGKYSLRVWDLQTGMCFRDIEEAHDYPITALSLTADGQYALTAAQDGRLKLWQLPAGSCLRSFPTPQGEIRAAAITPRGGQGVTLGRDGTLACWDLDRGQVIWQAALGARLAGCLAVTPDGAYALATTGDETGADQTHHRLRFWEVATGRQLRALEAAPSHVVPVTALAVRADGDFALSGDKQGGLKLWDLSSSNYRADFAIATIRRAEDAIEAQKKVTQLIRKSEEQLGRRRHNTAYLHIRNARNVAGYEHDQRLLDLTATIVRAGQRLSFRNAFCRSVLSGHDGPVNCLAAVAGEQVLSGSDDGSVRLWDLRQGNCLRAIAAKLPPVTALALLPGGQSLLVGTEPRLEWWGLDGQQRHVFEDPAEPRRGVRAAVVTADGAWALAAYEDNVAQCWSLRVLGDHTVFRQHGMPVYCLAASPDGRFAFTAGKDMRPCLWELPDGRRWRRFAGHRDSVSAVAITPDGDRALSGCWSGELKLWEVRTGKCLRSLAGHAGIIHALAIWADGRHAVSAGADKTLRLWELESGKCLRVLQGHTGAVLAVALSRDGRFIFSGSADQSLRVWETDWEWEFPDAVHWDQRLRPCLELFLERHGGEWEAADWDELGDEVRWRGFGWVEPAGLREELQLMKREYQRQSDDWLLKRYGELEE